MSPVQMKGLTLFVADLRSATSPESEERRVLSELAKIRSKFSSGKPLSGYDRKKYVWKLVYCYMLGFEVDIAHMEIVRLVSSQKYSEKNAGYIACSILLKESNDILRLIINLLKNELVHPSEAVTALALNCMANSATTEMSENLAKDVARIINPAANANPYLRQKAYSCLNKFFINDPNSLPTDVWLKRFQQIFNYEKDPGCLLTFTELLICVVQHDQAYSCLFPSVLETITRIIHGEVHVSYQFYGVPAPWLTIKLLKFLQLCPPPKNEILAQTNALIHSLLANATTAVLSQSSPAPLQSKKQKRAESNRFNKTNTENAVIFEAVNLAIYLENGLDNSARQKATAALGVFISSREANVRYLGLEAMSRIATDPSVIANLKRHIPDIVPRLSEPDISIRRQALNLLFAVCDKSNWGRIVDELLEKLKLADVLLQEELVLKIAILVEQNAPDFTWYVDVVFKMIEYAPSCVSDEICFRLIQVVTGFRTKEENSKVQIYAARKSFDYLSGQYVHEQLLRVGSYLLGEFGHKIQDDVSALEQINALKPHIARVSSSTRGLILVSIAKIAEVDQTLKTEVLGVLRMQLTSVDPDLQCRACELTALLKEGDGLVEKTLGVMPVYGAVNENWSVLARSKASMRGIGDKKKTRSPLPSSDDDDDDKNIDNSETDSDTKEDQQQSSSSSDSGEELSEDQDSIATKPFSPPSVNPTDIKGLWKNLCVTSKGYLYRSNDLSLLVMQEYKGNEGRIQIKHLNVSKTSKLTIESITLQETPTLKIREFSSPNNILLNPNEFYIHRLQVFLQKPFLNPPKYFVQLLVRPPSQSTEQVSQRLPFSLPITLAKFITPATLTKEKFLSFWEDVEFPGGSNGVCKVNPSEVDAYLTQAFNMKCLKIGNSLCCGGTLRSINQDKKGNVPCLCKVVCGKNNSISVSVRTPQKDVTNCLVQLLAAYLVNSE